MDQQYVDMGVLKKYLDGFLSEILDLSTLHQEEQNRERTAKSTHHHKQCKENPRIEKRQCTQLQGETHKNTNKMQT